MTVRPAPDHPPKPPLALTVGVVGHRPSRLPRDAAALAAIRAQVERVLDMLSAAAGAASAAHHGAFARERPHLFVLCGLAEGADRIVARAVIKRRPQDLELDAALPFPAAEYKKDFEAIDSKAEFDALRDAARAVLTIPGTRQNADDPDDPDAKKAYEALGLTVIAQSDILLTIWDSGPSGGRGGTTAMLDTAARLGMPIIHIDATKPDRVRMLWSELHEYPAPVNAAADLTGVALDQETLDTVIDRIVRPPKHEHHSRRLLYGHYSLQAYYNERFGHFDPWFLYRFFYPLLLAVSFVRWFRRSEIIPPAPQQLADDLCGMLATEANAAGESAAYQPSRLTDAYGWADSIGTRFALIFRSAFVVNFTFAAFAVAAAALSLVVFDPQGTPVFERFVDHKFPYVVVELAMIAIVLLNTVSGWRGRWHPRWIESREIAERLRATLPLWALGTRPAVFIGDEPTWTGWYTRAVVRAQALRNINFDVGELTKARSTLLAVLEDQRAYHRNTAARMSNLERRLEGVGLLLFIVAFFAVAVFLAAYWGGRTISIWQAYLVTAMAAGLPAVATAVYGIRVIGDFDGFAKRSARMCERLGALIDAIEADWPKASRKTRPPNFALLRARARSAEAAMLSDVQNWRLAAESRELTIPG